MLHLIFYSRANNYFPICSFGPGVSAVFIFLLHISLSGYVMSIFRFLLDNILHCWCWCTMEMSELIRMRNSQIPHQSLNIGGGGGGLGEGNQETVSPIMSSQDGSKVEWSWASTRNHQTLNSRWCLIVLMSGVRTGNGEHLMNKAKLVGGWSLMLFSSWSSEAIEYK